jgi:hypothetical protein
VITPTTPKSKAPPKRGVVKVTHCTCRVRCCGEGLDEAWWTGRQWIVSPFGIERRDGGYAIEAGRLAEGLEKPKDCPYPLLLAVAQESWSDVEDLGTAWLVAIVLHAVKVDARRLKSVIRRLPPTETHHV